MNSLRFSERTRFSRTGSALIAWACARRAERSLCSRPGEASNVERKDAERARVAKDFILDRIEEYEEDRRDGR